MRYRSVGTLSVSEVSLGTWFISDREKQAHTTKMVRTALDLGINLFDTADSYGDAEMVLGTALKEVSREAYVISTKVYFPYPGGTGGLSREHIRASVSRSLSRLKVDHIDLLSAHRFDDRVPLTETVAAFAELVQAGTIRHWGFSEWTAPQIDRACRVAAELGAPPPVSSQPQYNAIWRVPEERVIPACRRHGVGLLAFWPLAQGVLTGKYRPGQPPPPGTRAGSAAGRTTMAGFMHNAILERVELFSRLARRRDMTAAQLAVAWVLNRPTVTSGVVGASNPEQLRENAAASGTRLDDATMELIDKIFAGLINVAPDATG